MEIMTIVKLIRLLEDKKHVKISRKADLIRQSVENGEISEYNAVDLAMEYASTSEYSYINYSVTDETGNRTEHRTYYPYNRDSMVTALRLFKHCQSYSVDSVVYGHCFKPLENGSDLNDVERSSKK